MSENRLKKIVEIEYSTKFPLADSEDSRLADLKYETLRRLKKEKIYDETILYMPFGARNLDFVLKNGTTPQSLREKSIVAYPEDEDKHVRGLDFAIYLGHQGRRDGLWSKIVGKEGEFGIACYKGSCFNHFRLYVEFHTLKKGILFIDALGSILLYKPIE